MNKNPYEIIQVANHAEQEVIEAAYKRLARKYHPDVNASVEANERMKDLNWAYQILGDPIKRAEYDRTKAKSTAYTSEPSKPRPSHRTTRTTQDYTSRQTKRDYSQKRSSYSRPRADPKTYCQACGAAATTKYVEFEQTIGAIVLRFRKSIKGNLCKNCIEKYFSQFTLTTLLLGWWGIISAILTPFIVINNVVNYSKSRGMDRSPTYTDTKRRASKRGSNNTDIMIVLGFLGCMFVLWVISEMSTPALPAPISTTVAVNRTSTPKPQRTIIWKTLTPPPQPTKIPDAELPYILDFEEYPGSFDNAFGNTPSDNVFDIEEGQLVGTVNEKNSYWFYIGPSFENAILEVEVDAPSDSYFYIFFRSGTNQGGYFLWVGGWFWGVYYIDKSNVTVDIAPPRYIDNPINPMERNHWVIKMEGSKFTIYCNNQFLVDFQDSTFVSGRAGLGLATEKTVTTKIYFDNWRIIPLEDWISPVTLTPTP